MDSLAALERPFPPAVVHWRLGAVRGDQGMALAYIDARAVMDRLDEAVGRENWGDTYEFPGDTVLCHLSIRVRSENRDEWLMKSDGAPQTDIESEKGALSDAFKRAGVKWGIGRYLYNIDSPWVDVEKRGSSTVIAHHELGKLDQLLIASGFEGKHDVPAEAQDSPTSARPAQHPVEPPPEQPSRSRQSQPPADPPQSRPRSSTPPPAEGEGPPVKGPADSRNRLSEGKVKFFWGKGRAIADERKFEVEQMIHDICGVCEIESLEDMHWKSFEWAKQYMEEYF